MVRRDNAGIQPLEVPSRASMAEPAPSPESPTLLGLARFAALGQMLAELVHEINQPLTAIVNYARGCALRAESGALTPTGLRQTLGHISEQALDVAALVRRINEFAQEGSGERAPTDLNEIVREVAGFTQIHARHLGCALH